MKQYLAIIEWAGSNYSAYLPDLPGCISTGRTVEETEANLKEAVALYLDALAEDGVEPPEPRATTRAVSVAA